MSKLWLSLNSQGGLSQFFRNSAHYTKFRRHFLFFIYRAVVQKAAFLKSTF